MNAASPIRTAADDAPAHYDDEPAEVDQFGELDERPNGDEPDDSGHPPRR